MAESCTFPVIEARTRQDCMARYRVTTLAVCFAAWLLATPAAAQEGQGLSFVVGLGYERGGPAASLVESLEAAGWGETSDRLGTGPVEYPQAYTEGLNLTFMAGGRYRQGPVSVEALFSNGTRGHAEGFRATPRSNLLITWMSVRATATVGVHFGPVHLAAGPLLEAIFWSGEQNWSDLEGTMTPVLGGTATAGLSFPVGRERLALTAGARALPTIDLRPSLRLPVEARYGTYFIALMVQG